MHNRVFSAESFDQTWSTQATGSSRIASSCRKLDKGSRIFERVRAVDSEESAAIGTELLDRNLRSGRPELSCEESAGS
jgi:hypothetical protein